MSVTATVIVCLGAGLVFSALAEGERRQPSNKHLRVGLLAFYSIGLALLLDDPRAELAWWWVVVIFIGALTLLRLLAVALDVAVASADAIQRKRAQP